MTFVPSSYTIPSSHRRLHVAPLYISMPPFLTNPKATGAATTLLRSKGWCAIGNGLVDLKVHILLLNEATKKTLTPWHPKSGPKMTLVVMCGYVGLLMILEAVLDMATGMLLKKPFTWLYIYIYRERERGTQPAAISAIPPSIHQSTEVEERTPTADPSSITSFLWVEAKNEHLYGAWGRLEYRLDIWLT